MATQVIDLTDDCSSDENTTGHLAGKAPTSELNPTQYSAVHLAQLGARRPLQSITTPNVSGKSPYSTTPRADMNPALIQAIDIAKVERLREMLKLVCRENQSSRELVEKHLLVPLDQVSQSDLDSESEEDEESVASSEASASEEDDDDKQIIQRRIRRLKEEEEHENFLRRQPGKVYRTETEWREYAITHLEKCGRFSLDPEESFLRHAESREKRPHFSLASRHALTASPNSTPRKMRKEIVCGIGERRNLILIVIFGMMMIINGRERGNWRMILIMRTGICGIVVRKREVRRGVRRRNIRRVGGCERGLRRMGIEVWRLIPEG